MGVAVADQGFGAEAILERFGCPIHYWRSGAPDAPLVLLLHGAGIDHRVWEPQIAALSEDYRVVVLDIRGHGLSRPAGAYSFDALVDDAFVLLDRLGAGQAILIGLSMGGNIAQEMAFRRPERVAALVCLDCTCNTLVPLWDRLTLPFYRALFGPLMAAYPYRQLLRQIGEQSAVTPAVRRYVSEATAQLTKRELVMIMQTLFAALHDEPGYRVVVPELLLHGVDDALGNIRKVMPAWSARDGSRLVVIPDAGHCANMDNPAVFNQVVLDWLQDLDLRRAA